MIPRKWVALTLGAILLLHVQVLFGPLVFDDTHAVVQNQAIRSVANIPAFFVDPGLFSSSVGAMYRPLVLTTLTLDHALGGGAAWAFKLGNVLQHGLLCLLLLLLLPRLFRRAGLDHGLSGRATILAVLLFGIHPLHVESLCLVSSRSEILCALGFAIALLGWLRAGDRDRRLAQGLWLASGTAVACLSKETGILVPGAVLLVEFLLPAKGTRASLFHLEGLLLRFSPAVPIVGVYLVVRRALFGAATIGMRTLHTGGDPFDGGARDLATQLEGMALFLPKAVALWLCPVPLSLDHTAFPQLGFGSPPVVGGILFLSGCLLVALVGWRRRPLVSLGVLGSLLFALPWILIPLNVPFAEHRLYVPVMLWSIPLAAGLARLTERTRPVLAHGLVAGLLLFLGVRSVLYQHAWRDLQSVWTWALRWNPRSFRAWTGLADAALARGDLWQACRYLEKTHAIYPRYGAAAQNLREIRVRLLDQARTRAFADRTLSLVESWVEERFKDPFARLLAARARRGYYRFTRDPADLRRGMAWALSCLAMVEPKMLVFRTAAEVHRKGRQYVEALALFDAAEERELSNREFLAHKADILVEAGNLDEARTLIQRLSREAPLDALILGVRARCHAAADEPKAWRSVVGLLQGLGYDTKTLPRPPSLTGAGPR